MNIYTLAYTYLQTYIELSQYTSVKSVTEIRRRIEIVQTSKVVTWTPKDILVQVGKNLLGVEEY